jgi:hypothetical protein
MKQCPHCGRFNYDTATDCRECGVALPVQIQTLKKPYWMGPEKARALRSKALCFVVLGLLMKVYWGGYGAWRVVDNPTLTALRNWLEPLFLFGGAAVYLLGWVLNFV